MTVVGIAMVRDEADIVGITVGNMVEQCDHVIVADNRSSDDTRAILDEMPVTVIDDPVVGYYQAEKMTALAQRARSAFGATWVVPFDADEWWWSPEGRIADVLEATVDSGFWIAEADLYDHVATADDPADDNPVTRIGWRRNKKGALPKIAARPHTDLEIHMGNHGASYDEPVASVGGLLEVRHFPYRSPEQFVTKARNGAEAYAASDLPEHFGNHWRDYGRLLDAHGPEALHEVFTTWFYSAHPADDPSLVYDPVTP